MKKNIFHTVRRMNDCPVFFKVKYFLLVLPLYVHFFIYSLLLIWKPIAAVMVLLIITETVWP